jgi:hypothetical protein
MGGERNLIGLIECIRASRTVLPSPASLDTVQRIAQLLELHAPNGVVASLAKEVQIAAADLLRGRQSEPPAAMQRRLDDRIGRLEATLRASA